MNSISDRSLHFGLQNFIYVDSDETENDYDYVAYQNRKNVILLARYAKDGSSARYYATKGVYATIWANRKGTGSPTYVTIDALVDSKV